MSVIKKSNKNSVKTIKEKKGKGEKITVLTAYDYTFASILDHVGIDIILVGDSYSNVIAGNETTLSATLEEIIYHSKSVVKGVQSSMAVTDMPFGSYQVSIEKAVEACIKVMKETGVQAVKLEGGEPMVPLINKLVEIGIPVMGHLGLTPQSVHQFGGYGLRAKNEGEAERLKKDALKLQEAGCFSIVLEKIPHLLSKEISKQLSIPTIGIGAGKYCDGQVLVLYDMLGLNNNFKPKFVRRFLNLSDLVSESVKKYMAEVKAGTFPNEEEQY